MQEDDDRTTLQKQVRVNRRNDKALFALLCFIIAAATPSIVSQWQFTIENGQLVSADVRSRSFELGWIERLVISLCVAAALGVLSQKQLGELLAIVLKMFDKR